MSATGSATDGGVRRLPIRLRLTLPFALAMAFVLTALSAFVYFRVGTALSLDRPPPGARAVDALGHLAAVAAAARRRHRGRPGPTSPRSSRRNGGPECDAVGLPALLGDQRLQQCWRRRAPVLALDPGRPGDWRLLAVPVQTGGAPAALVLGRSLGSHDETLERLRDELLSPRRPRCCWRSSRATGSREPRCARSRRCGSAPRRSRARRRGAGCRCRRAATSSRGSPRR